MNYRYVVNQLGLLFVVIAVAMGAVAVFSAIQLALGDASESSALWSLLIGAGAGAVLGGACWQLTRRAPKKMERRESLLLVAMTWLMGSALGALPYFVWASLADTPPDHQFRSIVNCYFECVSGFTTTGATILSNIDQLPHSILLWRALTQWLGGLGIVVLFVAVLPTMGVGGKKLFRVEAPGPEQEGVHPHIRDTARILWLVYLGLTIAETVLLRIGGMGWFDAVCHTFTTLATGGFSTTDASAGGFGSVTIEVVLIVFMILAGGNFGLYYQLVRGKWRTVVGDTELRFYLFLLALGALLVIISANGQPMELTTGEQIGPSTGSAIREGLFTAASLQTTTGFCTADYNPWPYLAKATLIFTMFVGGCAGSTTGGIKVIRFWIVLKVLASEIERVFRPNVIRPVRVGGSAVDETAKLAALAYAIGTIFLFGLVSSLIMVIEPDADFATAGSATVATFCTTGPGLGRVGAINNYDWFTDASKLLLCVWMVVGRLEIFAIAVMFSPRFWRGD